LGKLPRWGFILKISDDLQAADTAIALVSEVARFNVLQFLRQVCNKSTTTDDHYTYRHCDRANSADCNPAALRQNRGHDTEETRQSLFNITDSERQRLRGVLRPLDMILHKIASR
jgi:hypothetical protein